MREHARFIIRVVIVAVLVAVCMAGVWRIVTVKDYYTGTMNTPTCLNFYKLPKNSIDVLFLGSSHSREAFIPQMLYDDYGITSYNLSTGAQPPLASYYWLREALYTQHPKTVILDTNLFPVNDRTCNTVSEVRYRQALDYMRWGRVKIEAIHATCKEHNKFSEISYYLPNVRYRERWKDLNEADFLLSELISSNDLMGYRGTYVGKSKYDYYPLNISQCETSETEVVSDYLEKIVQLCAENNIQLILVKTPFVQWTIGEHNCVSVIAYKYDVPFYDMNEETLYNELRFDLTCMAL